MHIIMGVLHVLGCLQYAQTDIRMLAVNMWYICAWVCNCSSWPSKMATACVQADIRMLAVNM